MPATWNVERWTQNEDGSYSRRVTGGLADLAEQGYSSWTKDDLAEELEKRDLPKSGTKAELVARLEEADAETD